MWNERGDWPNWAKGALCGGLVVAMAGLVGLGYLLAGGSGEVPATPRDALPPQAATPTADAPASTLPAPLSPAPESPASVMVEVQGAVAAPGSYSLPRGARLQDAIDRAGGPLPEGEIRDINIAARVLDGSVLTIPFAQRGAAPLPGAADLNAPAYTRSGWTEPAGSDSQSASAPTAPAVPGKINLNTASQAELETLPGVGEKTAQKIIQFRTSQPFTSVDDLRYIQGIGEKRIETLRPHVTVE